MSNKSRGSAAEWRYANKLRKEGWFVMKSGGSIGVADLIAINPVKGIIRLIQMKIVKDGYLSPKERLYYQEEFKKFVGMYKLDYEIIVKKSHKKKQKQIPFLGGSTF